MRYAKSLLDAFKNLDTKYIFMIKKTPDEEIERLKHRLWIRGFKQDYGVDFFDTFATVCRYLLLYVGVRV